MKKRELAIFFENANNNPEKNLRYVERNMTVFHTRLQTQDEIDSAPEPFKMFIKYSYYIDSKKWGSDIDKILNDNFHADENNVSEKERNDIKTKLKKAFLETYNNKKEIVQLSLLF